MWETSVIGLVLKRIKLGRWVRIGWIGVFWVELWGLEGGKMGDGKVSGRKREEQMS